MKDMNKIAKKLNLELGEVFRIEYNGEELMCEFVLNDPGEVFAIFGDRKIKADWLSKLIDGTAKVIHLNKKQEKVVVEMNEFKKARLEAGITQQEMSDLMKIPKRTIESWENDIRKPPEYVKRFVLNELAELALIDFVEVSDN